MFFLNSIIVKRAISLLVCLTLFACSSIEQVTSEQSAEEIYAKSSDIAHFPHNQFSITSKESIKKTLNSDHHLMMSLLNRPMTADQVMMLTFAQERADYASHYTHFANNAVMIKGEKSSDNSNSRTEHAYAQLISQDINAVSISAPQ